MRGAELLSWDPQAATIPPGEDAGPYNWISGYLRSIPRLVFPHSVDRSLLFVSPFLPFEYTGRGLRATIRHASFASPSGVLKFELSFQRIIVGTTNADSEVFGTVSAFDGSCSGQSGLIEETTFDLADGNLIDDIERGDPFRVKLTRKGTDVGDTAERISFEGFFLDEL